MAAPASALHCSHMNHLNMVVNGFDESRDRFIEYHVGLPAGANEAGELFVRGAQVSGEYVGSGSALEAFCRERVRSRKTPDTIRIWDELPYTPTGKLLRRPFPWQRG
jgi:acyl-CoA synthetase (AMP-forming)/AMP-acid ligase II